VKAPLPLSDADKTAVCKTALADLFERDIAELQQTKQPGGASVCRQLKRAVREIRTPRRGWNSSCELSRCNLIRLGRD
jgi:hypothetical protein